MKETNINNEINLKELMIILIDWIRYVLSQWKLIFIVGFIGGTSGIVYAFMAKKVYTAEISFFLDDKEGGGSLGNIASQLGFDFSKNDAGALSGDNVLILAKSRHLIQQSLFTEIENDGKKDILLNRYLTFNEIDKAWGSSDRPEIKNLKFTAGMNQKQMNHTQDSVLEVIYKSVREKVIIDRIDKRLSMLKVVCKSEDQIFAKEMVEILVKNVSDFYIETKTQKTKANIKVLQNRLDSVKSVLDMEMVSVATIQDRNQNTVMMKGKIPVTKKQIQVQILTTMYSELIKNLELAKLTLMREEPIIQIIDEPRYPLEFQRPRKIISAFAGSFFLTFLTVIVLVFRKWWREG